MAKVRDGSCRPRLHATTRGAKLKRNLYARQEVNSASGRLVWRVAGGVCADPADESVVSTVFFSGGATSRTFLIW